MSSQSIQTKINHLLINEINPQLIQPDIQSKINYLLSKYTIPSSAIPSSAIPSSAIPSSAIPSSKILNKGIIDSVDSKLYDALIRTTINDGTTNIIDEMFKVDGNKLIVNVKSSTKTSQ